MRRKKYCSRKMGFKFLKALFGNKSKNKNKSDVKAHKVIGTCQKASVVRLEGLPLAISERIQLQNNEIKCVLSCFSRIQLCATMDCSPPNFPVHGISQARVLGWAAPSYSGGSSWSGYGTGVSCSSHIAGRLYHGATGEAQWVNKC